MTKQSSTFDLQLEKLIYSGDACGPSTLARDARRLINGGHIVPADVSHRKYQFF